MLKENSIKNRIINILLGSTFFVLVISIWQLLISFNITPSWILPSPVDTFSALLEIIKTGEIYHLLGISLLNVLPPFIFASFMAAIIGVLVGTSKIFRKMFLPFLSSIFLIPSLAWLPLVILFAGFTRFTIWIVIFISCFVRTIYIVIGGVQGINNNWILAGKNLGLNKFEIIIKIIFPAAVPQIISGLRVGFGSAWKSLIGAEMLVVLAGGLGKYIWMSQWAFSFDQVFSGILLIAAIGLIFEQLFFKQIEKYTLQRWGMANEEVE